MWASCEKVYNALLAHLPPQMHLFSHVPPTSLYHSESFNCRKQNASQSGFSKKGKPFTHTAGTFKVDVSQLQAQLDPDILMVLSGIDLTPYWSVLLLPPGDRVAAKFSKLQSSLLATPAEILMEVPDSSHTGLAIVFYTSLKNLVVGSVGYADE